MTNSAYTITLIPQGSVANLAEKAIALLESRPVERATFNHDVATSIISACVDGEADLWTVTNYKNSSDPIICGVFTTAVQEIKDYKVLNVQHISGYDFKGWSRHLHDSLIKIARDNGIRAITFTGSRAYKRIWPNLREFETTFIFDVDSCVSGYTD